MFCWLVGWPLVVVVQFWEYSAEFSLQSSKKMMMLVGGEPPPPRHAQVLLCASCSRSELFEGRGVGFKGGARERERKGRKRQKEIMREKKREKEKKRYDVMRIE